MKTLATLLLASAAALAGCGDSSTGTANPTPQDSGTAALDAGTPDAGSTEVDAGAAPTDTGPTYPVGTYGSSVGALLRPFELEACNRAGEEAMWRFDRNGFFDANLTVISIAAGWCVPCQNETMQMQQQIVERYADRGVRVVQLLVQNPDRSAITRNFCNTWVNRYNLTIPELMDPTFITQPFVPNTAFPGNVIVDRCGRIRWREYGSTQGLASLREAIEDVLADPRYPNCPTDE